MPTEKNQPRYQIKLHAVRGEVFDDVIFCSCIKSPFYKCASYWVLKIVVSSVWAMQLLNDLSKSTTRQFNLEIVSVKHEGEFDSLDDKETSIERVHFKTYNCINAINGLGNYAIDVGNQNATIIMTLSDHIFYDMYNKRSFNKRLKDITAYEAIEKFYEHMNSRYGTSTFWYNKVNLEQSINDYKYEELLLLSNNDITIPERLLYSQKALQDISLHFYDDFCLHPDCNKPLACHFVNFKNLQNFPQFNVMKYFDTLYTLQRLRDYPYSDAFRQLTNGYDSIIQESKYGFNYQHLDKNRPLYHPKVENYEVQEYLINEERKANVVVMERTDIKHENKDDSSVPNERQKPMIVYTPDTVAKSEERIKNFKLFSEDTVKQCVMFQIMDCFCDFLQFGVSYNFDLVYNTEYIYTPISICNIFFKEGAERSVKHMIKTIMLEYSRSEYTVEKTCSSCKFFVDTLCTLHYITKESNGSCFDHTSN